MTGLPLLLEGSALRVLVVGGGEVAARRARLFAEAGARVRIVARELGEPLRRLVVERGWDCREGDYRREDIGDALVIVAATDDAGVNAQVAGDAHARGVLVNVADASAPGTLVPMVVHRSGPLVIAVSAGGVPAAAVRIRDALARRFDGRYARALQRLCAERREHLDAGGRALWRRRSAAVVDERFCERVERGEFENEGDAWR